MNIKPILVFFLVSIISACGGGSGSSNAEPTSQTPTPEQVFTGRFVDSVVQGLTYQTPTQTGVTNSDGEFKYQSGEMVTFSIGGIVLPETASAALISPLDVFATENIDDIRVSNLARLLQSLDVDGVAENGLEISAKSTELAANMEIDFSSTAFDMSVESLLIESAGVYQSLISAEQAKYHLQMTLGLMAEEMPSECTSVNSKVGYSGSFQTLAHNVAGDAVINDDCTITISNFYYDGGGPDVFVYTGVNGDFANGYKISEQLNGREYNGETLTLKLPEGLSLDDFTGLSIWCVDFNADFGNLEFTP
ncbi:DM13 domain-containing protein [Thalassomonas sp. M1454]|uniref:DM13 domain-containing protein n=1 Tax=Thalassomonas sp. M1454 TaxID=2594477 RepID=UPI00163DBE9C|nr:DM13 domain-containing protein [Thalassomonas sp. M1454]